MSTSARSQSVLALFTMLFSMAKIILPQDGQHRQPIQGRVPYCQIVSHSRKYDHRILETQGIYTRGGENTSFYSLACPDDERSSWVDKSDELKRATPPELISKLANLLGASGRVQVVAVVKFDGPKKVDIPAGTPSAVAGLMRGTNSRYGHMNRFASRITLLRLLKVDAVPPGAPWPH